MENRLHPRSTSRCQLQREGVLLISIHRACRHRAVWNRGDGTKLVLSLQFAYVPKLWQRLHLPGATGWGQLGSGWRKLGLCRRDRMGSLAIATTTIAFSAAALTAFAAAALALTAAALTLTTAALTAAAFAIAAATFPTATWMRHELERCNYDLLPRVLCRPSQRLLHGSE